MKKIFCIFSLCLLFSCNKDGNNYVEGHVYAAGSSIPIGGAEVHVTQSYHHNQAPSIASVITDSEGYFKLRYHKGKIGYQQYLTASSRKASDGHEERIGEKHYKTDVYLPARLIMKYRIINSLATSLDLNSDGLVNEKRIRAGADTLLKDYYSFLDYGKHTLNWHYTTKPGNVRSKDLATPVQPITFGDTLICILKIE